MPIKKNTVAVSTAIQTGLSVRGAVKPVKASKSVASTTRKTAVQTRKTATPAKATKVAAPKKTVRAKAVKAAPAADVAMWDENSLLADAARKVVRHVHKFSRMDGYEPLKLTSSDAYWAQADKAVSTGGPTASAGSWMLAFDYTDPKDGTSRVRAYTPTGQIVLDFPADQKVALTYFND